MLRTETVTDHTLELLISLMLDKELNDFFLVGGTALSLQIGHRISIDIDLFSRQSFDVNELLSYLESKDFTLDFLDKNTIKGKINGVAVDLITHAYPLANDIIVTDGIRMASLEDIAAMKLNAIVSNGTRLKDFIDITYLSSYLSLKQMMDAYEQKYTSRNPVLILKSLAFHDEINHNEPINLLNPNIQWKVFAKRIKEMIQTPGKIFPKFLKK